ncbi:hypothetical protein GGS23DRAFT_594241 [Durotheca rogersii]|uniref:uncharacterized protein n=1 Tax=Durotheca rogersii TaxID=419775 RepID=UPI00221F2ADA|nr:uncharacterized protein GGS23DRAFT_594241 [Durotheca rogersii]KAI5866090.1 hypothetical protein GGS23DRAFT_594241 [Durotheca rogersii]
MTHTPFGILLVLAPPKAASGLLLSVATAKIQSPGQYSFFSTLSSCPVLPHEVDLNLNEAIRSSRQSSLTTITTIPSSDYPVVTTDSQQTPWLPSSSSSPPAPPAQSRFPQHPPQQDFVLFDQPTPQGQNVNRPLASASAAAAAFGSRHPHLNHSAQFSHRSPRPSLPNHRVAQIIQALGHQSSPSTVFTNLHNLHAQNQTQQSPYAPLSSPSSAAPVQRSRVAHPPVPPFQPGIGTQQPAANMNLQGNLPNVTPGIDGPFSPEIDALAFEDFTPFEGGASTAYPSPGVPGYDMNGSSASSTVSPRDLLLHDTFTSAPNSSALTNLTSPSIYDGSPDFHDSYEVSPNFGPSDIDSGTNDNWFSLFPPAENTITNPAPTAPAVEASPVEESEVIEAASNARRKSKSSHSPPSGAHGRHSSIAGVSSRRRDRPLPPIVVEDSTDAVAMKRARNTLAARKSRERKAQRFEELEEQIVQLTQERDHWKSIALQKTG